MQTARSDLYLLDDPVVKRLLASSVHAQLAYDWRHGTPRVMATWFSWDGDQFNLWTCRPPTCRGLIEGSKVFLTVDHKYWPFTILVVRGSIHRVREVPLATPERRFRPQREEIPGDGKPLFPFPYLRILLSKMTQISVDPEWVGTSGVETI